MKKAWFLLLLLPTLAWSAPVSLDLQSVPMKDLIRLVYGELLGVNYVLDASIQDDLKPVSLSLKNVQPSEAETILKGLLKAQGVAVKTSAGVYLVQKAMPDEETKEIFIYRPQYRSVQYLMELTQTLFPQGSFVAQRGSAMNIGQVVGNSAFTNQPGLSTGTTQQANLGGTVAGVNQGLNSKLTTDSDTLVFNSQPKDIERFKKLLADLDVPTGEVMVKAVIYEVQTNNKTGSAIDLAVSILSSKFGLKLTGGAADSLSNAFVKLSMGGIDLSAAYSALASDVRFKTVSSPRVRVRSGASAHFSVGDETPILSSVSYDSTGKPIQSVTYKPSGVIFDLTPQVREQGVDLHLLQTISSFVTTTNGVNNSPTLNKRELSSDLTMSDGEMIVIGGLETDRDTKNKSGLSFLPAFFQSESSDQARTEIVLMLNVQRI